MASFSKSNLLENSSSPNHEFQIQKYLQNQGFRVVDIIEDGNCLFRAVFYLINGDQDIHVRYRRLAVQHINMNRDFFGNFLDDNFDRDIDQYCKKMALDGTWGGHIEIFALSAVLKRKFIIFNESEEIVPIEAGTFPNNAPLHLAYDCIKLHYSSLIQITNENDDQNLPENDNKKLKKRKRDEAFQEKKQIESHSQLKKFKDDFGTGDNKMKKQSSAPIQINIRKKQDFISNKILTSTYCYYRMKE